MYGHSEAGWVGLGGWGISSPDGSNRDGFRYAAETNQNNKGDENEHTERRERRERNEPIDFGCLTMAGREFLGDCRRTTVPQWMRFAF